MDIPREVCVRAKVNPRKIKRPIVKKWCYTPKEEEEGLDSDEDNDLDENESDENEDTTFAPENAETAPPRRG